MNSTNLTDTQSYITYLHSLLDQHSIKYHSESDYQNIFKEQTNKDKNEPKTLQLKSNLSPELQGKLVQRYCRQMLLKQISYQGQLKIVKTKVAIIGSGGIGCPLAMYLAGAGIGTIGLFDSDTVDMTNLHRQIGHKNSSVGIKKTQSLKNTLLQFNPEIQIIQNEFITVQSVEKLEQYDLIIDGSDNPQCRYIVNDYCMKNHKKLLSGACIGWEAQLTCYGGQSNPCYRCIWGNEQKTTGGCSTLGVVGMIPGFVGIILAIQAIKMILNGSSSLQGHLLTYQSKSCVFRKIKLRNKIKQCIGCGQNKLNMKQYDYSKHAVCKVNLSNLPTVPEIDWENYLSDWSRKTKILDVRPSNQFNIVHLENMINLPFEKLSNLSQKQLKKFISENLLQTEDKKIFVSCNRGVISKRACDHLLKSGYSALSITGGITGYKKDFDNSIPLL